MGHPKAQVRGSASVTEVVALAVHSHDAEEVEVPHQMSEHLHSEEVVGQTTEVAGGSLNQCQQVADLVAAVEDFVQVCQ